MVQMSQVKIGVVRYLTKGHTVINDRFGNEVPSNSGHSEDVSSLQNDLNT